MAPLLVWHRRFLRQFELRLQQIDPDLSVPFWDWIADRESRPHSMIPTRSRPLERHPGLDSAGHAPPRPNSIPRWHMQFQPLQRLEAGPHAEVHVAVGGEAGTGTMNSPSSPADPIFSLHHANIDRLWTQWHDHHKTAQPSNLTETLQPTPLFGVTLASQLDPAALGLPLRLITSRHVCSWMIRWR